MCDMNEMPTDTEVVAQIRAMLTRGDALHETKAAPRAALEIIMTMTEADTFEDRPAVGEALHWLVHQALNGLAVIEQERRDMRDLVRALRVTDGEAA